MSFYNDDHDYENGPALAGPAESAHNMTLELSVLLSTVSTRPPKQH